MTRFGNLRLRLPLVLLSRAAASESLQAHAAELID